ncbi:hypothetical protein MEO41_29275, partial [Dolichospermum sp. ST_sed4]|nr:hypothetical protein [Dolichospermum sp. ST_sed4]
DQNHKKRGAKFCVHELKNPVQNAKTQKIAVRKTQGLQLSGTFKVSGVVEAMLNIIVDVMPNHFTSCRLENMKFPCVLILG